MSYRDDRDADQARIGALQSELDGARRRIDELEGRRSLALIDDRAIAPTEAPAARPPWYGAPLRLELVRTYAGVYPAADFEELVGVLRAVTKDAGRTEILKSSMTWTASTGDRSIGPFTIVTVTVSPEGTTLVATDRLGQLAGAIYGGVGGGVGGGGIMLPLLTAWVSPILVPIALVGWFGGWFLGTRALFKRAARRRAATLHGVFTRVGEAIAAKLRATAA